MDNAGGLAAFLAFVDDMSDDEEDLQLEGIAAALPRRMPGNYQILAL